MDNNAISFALIPAYMPGENLISLLKSLSEKGFRIVTVDDGSGERFSSVFEKARNYAEVLVHPQNRGKGEALKTGLRFISTNYTGEDPPKNPEKKPVFVVTADSDGQHRVEDILRVSEESRRCPDSLILGSRRLDQNAPKKSVLGNAATRVLYRLSTGRAIYETQTGLRGFSEEMFDRFIALRGSRYEYEMDMMLRSSCEKIREVPIETVYINNNSESHFRPLEDTLTLYKEFLKFGVPSIVKAALDLSLFFIFAAVLKNVIFSNVIAWAAGTLAKFILQRHSTLHDVRGGKKAARFLLSSLFMLALSTGFLRLFCLWMPLVLSKLLAELLVFIIYRILKKLFWKVKK